MNRTKIEYCDYTWNPVTGCHHGCPYCYARRMGMRFQGHFKPTLHVNRLTQPAKCPTPSTIFVCSMADLFGEWVPNEWIFRVLEVARNCPQHTFLFLTKNPDRFNDSWFDFKFHPNCFLGATIDTAYRASTSWRIMYPMMGAGGFVKNWLSAEPLLEDLDSDCWRWIEQYEQTEVIVIGAQTGPGAVKPDEQWVVNIIHHCEDAGVKFFLKNNIDEGLRDMYSEHKLNGLPWEVREQPHE